MIHSLDFPLILGISCLTLPDPPGSLARVEDHFVKILLTMWPEISKLRSKKAQVGIIAHTETLWGNSIRTPK